MTGLRAHARLLLGGALVAFVGAVAVSGLDLRCGGGEASSAPVPADLTSVIVHGARAAARAGEVDPRLAGLPEVRRWLERMSFGSLLVEWTETVGPTSPLVRALPGGRTLSCSFVPSAMGGVRVVRASISDGDESVRVLAGPAIGTGRATIYPEGDFLLIFDGARLEPGARAAAWLADVGGR